MNFEEFRRKFLISLYFPLIPRSFFLNIVILKKLIFSCTAGQFWLIKIKFFDSKKLFFWTMYRPGNVDNNSFELYFDTACI